ncbi:hypothetical protein NL676_027242 [Syzygium grande]|nr:hypothetical protein NL676_027242 [Syzygium grande]
MKEAKTQVTADVGIDSLWKCLSKDLYSIVPQVLPNLVQNGEIIEGDGGLGSVILFNFGPDVPNMKYQKEKIMELDESLHRIGLQVIEGGHLDLGFTFYKTTFQLTSISEKQTLVDVAEHSNVAGCFKSVAAAHRRAANCFNAVAAGSQTMEEVLHGFILDKHQQNGDYAADPES